MYIFYVINISHIVLNLPYLYFVGTFTGALCLMLIKVAGCSHVAVIALVVLSTAFITFCDSGYNVNHIDIAPNFAGKTDTDMQKALV